MANALPKIINNDPEIVAVSTVATSVDSSEFVFVHNCQSEGFNIDGNSAEVEPIATSSSSTVTINKSGKYTISGLDIQIAPDGSNFYSFIGLTVISVFLNEGAAVKASGNVLIGGRSESFTNAQYFCPSGTSLSSSRYIKSSFLNIV